MPISDDEWAGAWSSLTSALEKAWEAGMTEEEIIECIENTRPDPDMTYTNPLKPKKVGRPKKGK